MRPKIVKNDSQDQSDSDDWTLLSPPSSSSSSVPECLDLKDEIQSIKLEEITPMKVEIEDGLSEIDLNDEGDDGQPSASNNASKRPSKTVSDDIDKSDTALLKLESVRLQSKTIDHIDNADKPIKSSEKRKIIVRVPVTLGRKRSLKKEPSLTTRTVSNEDEPQSSFKLLARTIFIAKYIIIFIAISSYIANWFTNQTEPLSDYERFGLNTQISDGNLVYLNNSLLGHLSSFRELNRLNLELEECVKRQERTNPIIEIPQGVVCRGQEAYWLKRFDMLKSEYGLDFRQFVQQVKNFLPNEHLTLNLREGKIGVKLLLHQMEYLDHLNTTLVKLQNEVTIKLLRAENAVLTERLKHPNQSVFKKLLVDLELENSKLVRENEALRASLLEKVGPVYMKKAQESEKFERENVLLKQFYIQISQDISKSLKQLGLYSIETSGIIDDQENLKSKMMLTRGNLRRLGEKVGTILIENEGLKEELRDIYYSSTNNKANLPAIHIGNQKYGSDNNSNALMGDECRKNLLALREESSNLQIEVDKLRRDCSKHKSNVGLEVGSQRYLNRTAREKLNKPAMLDWDKLNSIGVSQLPVERSSQDVENGRIVDDLMAFLIKFNNYAESNELARTESDLHPLQEYPSTFSPVQDSKENNEAKVIPNYIRDAVRRRDEKVENLHDVKLESNNQLPPKPIIPLEHFYYQPLSVSTETKKVVKNSPSDETVSSNIVNKSEREYNGACTDLKTTRYRNLSDPPILRDSWFFKRAKQRKQLRDDKFSPNQSDWLMKRAKLRAKLRKASSYMDTYLAKSRSYSLIKKQLSNLKIHKGHSFEESEQKQKQRAAKPIRRKYIHDEL